jgi:hypothetical protein
MKIKIPMKKLVLIFILFTFTSPLPVLAVDYYVDINNGSASDSNPGTLSQPWKTITKANQTLIAGDTAYIKAGTYSSYIAPTHSGTSENARIIYKNYGTDTVTIQNATYAIYLSGKSFITVQGINFQNCSQFMYIQNNSNYNIISNCTLNQCSTSGWVTGSLIQNSRYNWIHHNTFSGCGVCSGGNGQGTVMDIGSDEDSGAGTANFNLIENNTFYHGGHHVVGLCNRYNTFRNNYLYNDAWTNGRGERTLYMAGWSASNGYNLVEGNRFGYTALPCNSSTVGNVSLSTSYNIFRYNSMYHNFAYSLGLYSYYGSGSQYDSGSNNTIYNNTIYNSDLAVPSGYEGEASAIYVSTPYTTGNLIKNNLLYRYTSQWLTVSASARQTFVNNWSGDSQGNPLFVNASTTPPADKTDVTLPNLNLMSNSPAIDTGGPLTTVVSATGSGTSITVSNARYFQDGTYGPPGVVQADWIAVGTPTNVVQISSISGNTINLVSPISWTTGNSIWLYKKSDGVRVLYGTAPDAGAYEFIQGQILAPSAPTNLRVNVP